MKKYFITGVAGFIGFHLTKRLIRNGHFVMGIDNLVEHLPSNLKQHRLEYLKSLPCFEFYKLELEDVLGLESFISRYKFDCVIHLAAESGIGRSLDAPEDYIDSNITGFLNILERCRQDHIDNFIFASSSSVYGNEATLPSVEHYNTDRPESLYSATKKANELIAHAYSKSFGIRTVGLRFFNVYGPVGRPDSVFSIFANAIMKNLEVELRGYGEAKRDFTYIDDVVDAIVRVLYGLPASFLHKIYNVGTGNSFTISSVMRLLECHLGGRANIKMVPMNKGEVFNSCADINFIRKDYGYELSVSINEGIERFAEWYKQYYS